MEDYSSKMKDPVQAAEIGRRIRETRLFNNMTVEKLSSLVDLSSSYIALIERGERSPSLKSIIKIGVILNVSLDYLVYGDLMNADKRLAPVYFVDEDDSGEDSVSTEDSECDWEKIEKTAAFSSRVDDIVRMYKFNNAETKVLLNSLEFYAKQMNIIKNMKKYKQK